MIIVHLDAPPAPSRKIPTEHMKIPTQTRTTLSVTQLNASVSQLLESSFSVIWVEGELSNLSRPSSGHWYFTLKDSNAQVRAAMFRSRNQVTRFNPNSGMHVRVRARVSLYEARGDYQLIVEHIEEAGEGALRRAFEVLRLKLSEEGLFEAARKKPLPPFPNCIGIITSPTGAALRDVLSVLNRRLPALPVRVYPVTVQGEDAVPSITTALAQANLDKRCDVLIVTRGGGSIEDLWAFNEEAVARAIAQSHIPIVSAIGHETDITIADFAADVRAPTPSVAAELVSPDRVTLNHRLLQHERHVKSALARQLDTLKRQVQWLSERLSQRHPLNRLLQHGQRLDELDLRLRRIYWRQIQQLNATLTTYQLRLERQTPIKQIPLQQNTVNQLTKRLETALTGRVTHASQRLSGMVRTLEAVSPLATLGRGYAIVFDELGVAVRDANQVKPGDEIHARLARGQLFCQVLKRDTPN